DLEAVDDGERVGEVPPAFDDEAHELIFYGYAFRERAGVRARLVAQREHLSVGEAARRPGAMLLLRAAARDHRHAHARRGAPARQVLLARPSAARAPLFRRVRAHPRLGRYALSQGAFLRPLPAR